jgi:hypothetical protein
VTASVGIVDNASSVTIAKGRDDQQHGDIDIMRATAPRFQQRGNAAASGRTSGQAGYWPWRSRSKIPMPR